MKDSQDNYLDPQGGTKLFSKRKQKIIEHLGNRKSREVEVGVFNHLIDGLIIMTQKQMNKTDYVKVENETK